MSVYGYGDREVKKDQSVINSLLKTHRESLQKMDNTSRQKLKETNWQYVVLGGLKK